MSMKKVTRYADAEIPTRYGTLRVLVYRDGAHEHLAIVSGDVAGKPGVMARVHSECFTGEVLHSLKCDCGEQLDRSLRTITAEGGVVIYLRQEGRGIGLGNKIRAYALQSQGRDTIQANVELGFEPDARDYAAAVAMLRDLGVASVALMTNNPDKLAALEAAGVQVVRHPHWVSNEQEHNREYLQVKRDKMGHLPDEPPAAPIAPAAAPAAALKKRSGSGT
jgi:3,4-dihydroxy 2-butanone 4-phosphate synthase/GTP cyclohydrolase II